MFLVLSKLHQVSLMVSVKGLTDFQVIWQSGINEDRGGDGETWELDERTQAEMEEAERNADRDWCVFHC